MPARSRPTASCSSASRLRLSLGAQIDGAETFAGRAQPGQALVQARRIGRRHGLAHLVVGEQRQRLLLQPLAHDGDAGRQRLVGMRPLGLGHGEPFAQRG
jgi:hypothetical protein